MNKELFTRNIKLADIIDLDCRLLYVLPRFGIKLGFGDITVSDICQKKEINEDVFLLICNISAFEDYIPRLGEMSAISLENIMYYLKQSHGDYLTNRIPHIISHIESFAHQAHTRQRDIIMQFCENYKKDIVEHFNYEERTVFPYIESLINGSSDKKYKIENFLHNHSNIDDKLHDLKSIIMKYTEHGDDSDGRDLLFDIYMLEEDLKRHTIIEEKILAALAEMIEQQKQ